MIRVLFFLWARLSAEDWIGARAPYEGQETVLTTMDGNKHKGWFGSATPDAIVLQTKAGERSFAKREVLQVSVKRRDRLPRASTGALIGASIPIFAGLIARSWGAAPYIPPFALYGAGLGSIGRTHEPVYRRNVP
ncbi:MAG: hypothetical protein FJW30_02640 [Acidobacteria bacterium]|nr:hypothetical protein [Acidobacteriota bacterium]